MNALRGPPHRSQRGEAVRAPRTAAMHGTMDPVGAVVSCLVLPPRRSGHGLETAAVFAADSASFSRIRSGAA